MTIESKVEPAGANGEVTENNESVEIQAELVAARSIVEMIQEILKAAKANGESAAEINRALTSAQGDAQARLAEIIAVSTMALSAKTQIVDVQTVIATKSDHIQQAQEHADKVRGDLDRVLTAAAASSSEAEGLKTRIQTAVDSGAESLTAIRVSKASAEADAAAALKERESAKASAAATKSLAEKAESIEQRIAGYETRLADLEIQCDSQLKTITELLPGATSAGLASAFAARRQTFLNPEKRWQWIFIGSLAAIAGLAFHGLWQVTHLGTTMTFTSLMLNWLARLPMAGALVWAAMHSSRESALAKRLEEDYGYKATVAASFQGFVEQMAKLGSTAGPNSPLAKLCEDTLRTIATPPGRIYEKHKLTVSPAAAVGEAAASLTKHR